MTKLLFPLVVAGIALFAQLSPAQTLIGINFGADQQAGEIQPGDFAGVVPQSHWNNTTGGSGTVLDLLDDAGNTTAVGVTWSSSNTWRAWTGGADNGDQRLLQGYLDGGSNGVPAAVTVSNIPFSVYNVYVYINRDGDNSTSTYTVNGQSQTVTPGAYATTLSLAGPAAPGVPNASTAGTYILFTNVTGSSLSLLTSNAASYPQSLDWRSPVNGIQIVAVPEPAAGALAGFAIAAGAMLVIRRKTA
ncbi:PEP-CTERM protein-sorting domain-containing protein [Terrimicrobium sacchariphilum]|uniref:PEP-CTERM protein-sorting domain-containing protein n=1 Tax=Terrimicrobium sacchariphilum TaxID=690879 RepID=A0A146G819_TERSA|nr:hypothetical protein [Terrimicrobium sacchariphilum]GAT33054.1 PEP-CTERM protein-sorting domain-containing protein [Terrimicrobium sacchariphilum]